MLETLVVGNDYTNYRVVQKINTAYNENSKTEIFLILNCNFMFRIYIGLSHKIFRATAQLFFYHPVERALTKHDMILYSSYTYV